LLINLTSCEALDHRHIDVWLALWSGEPFTFRKSPVRKNAGALALVAIRRRMVARQALQQHRSLLQDRRVDLNVAKAGARRR
jgi:hypothetical protein